MLRRADVATLGTGRVVYVRGTAYQQGRQLGEAAADLIRENVDRATQLCQSVAAGFDLSAYTTMTRRNERWVEHVYPELLEELHGVAQTSGIAYEDLLHLNLLVRIMSDHVEPPTESICRHGGDAGGGQTYAAMVICPQDRRVWAMFGSPCEGIQAVGRPGE